MHFIVGRIKVTRLTDYKFCNILRAQIVKVADYTSPLSKLGSLLNENREFKKPRRRRRGQRRLKMNLHFTYESRDILKSFSLFLTVQTIPKLNMERSVIFGI